MAKHVWDSIFVLAVYMVFCFTMPGTRVCDDYHETSSTSVLSVSNLDIININTFESFIYAGRTSIVAAWNFLNDINICAHDYFVSCGVNG